MTNLNAKNVLITGGARGIGKLIAFGAAQKGANVILWDRNKEALLQTTEEGLAKGYSISFHVCDVSNKEEVYAIAGDVLKKHGKIDVLINNAGIVSGKGLLECADDDILRTMNVNILSNFWSVRSFLPKMLENNDGHIVTIASAAGIMGSPKLIDYCTSKFAQFGFNESLRLELKARKMNIRTTVVCPFFIDTGMFSGVTTRFGFVLPILKPQYVADRVIQSIEENRGTLIMPRFVHLVAPLRMLPTNLFDSVASFLGLNKSMDDFKGHAKS